MAETTRRLFPLAYRALPLFLEDLAAEYGPIAAFRTPWRSFVLLNDPIAIKDVLVTQQHAFHKSAGGRALGNLLGEGLLTSEDPLHRQMRRIVQPAFHRAHIASYGKSMIAHANDFVAGLEDGSFGDIHATMSELTLAIAGTTLFGTDTAAQSQIVRHALRDALETFPASVGPFGRLRRALPFLPSTKRFNRARTMLDNVVYGLIRERRQSGEDRGDALSLLLAAEGSGGEVHLSDQRIRDEVMTLFIAGHETTANALTWTWYLLSQHPLVEARLHAELDRVDAGEDPLDMMRDLEYTHRVVREALRLYPPAWILGREAQKDLRVAEYAIARNTTVLMSPLLLHRRPDLYPDPLAFNPDRWLGWEPAPFAFIPFGAGSRRCIGEEFAWMETMLLLATIGRSCRFILETGACVETEAVVTLRPRYGMPMRLSKRIRPEQR